MRNKLTLRLEKDLVEYAHDLARRSRDSISHIFSVYLEKLRSQDGKRKTSSKSQLSAFQGCLKAYPKLDKKSLVLQKFGAHERSR